MTGGGLRDLGGGEFLGHETRRFATPQVWFEVLAGGGPRIVRFGLAGGPNLFAELPGIAWETPEGRFESLGGHRLWYAPETLEPAVPDGFGLRLEVLDDSIRLVGRVEPSGLRRTIEIAPGSDDAHLAVEHIIANEGPTGVEIALWPITAFRTGGLALVPQPRRRPEHDVVANRPVVLWPYSSWEDDRLSVIEGAVVLRAEPAPPIKVACLSQTGSMAYLLDDVLFEKRFDPDAAADRFDFGCNAELFANERNVEIESLGPKVRLAPGASARHLERWSVRTVTVSPPSVRDADRLRALVRDLGLA